jgi:hypothetical protein
MDTIYQQNGKSTHVSLLGPLVYRQS